MNNQPQSISTINRSLDGTATETAVASSRGLGLRKFFAPPIKAFIAGFLGTIPYAAMRGHAQQRWKQEANTENPEKAAEATESLPVKFRTWSEKTIPGMDDPKGETQKTYTEFAYSFFFFPMGLAFFKPILDKIFPDDPHEASAKAQEKALEDAGKPKQSFMRRAANNIFHYGLRFPVACFAALIPYALMGRALESTILKPMEKDTLHDEIMGKDAPPPTPLEAAREKTNDLIQDPWARLQIKVGVMFGTFNLAYHYTNRLIDMAFGARPGTKENTFIEKDEKIGIIDRISRHVKHAIGGIFTPVFFSVAPLVATFFFTTQKNIDNHREKLEAIKAEGETPTPYQHIKTAGFAAGNALNNAASALYNGASRLPFAQQIQQGIEEKFGMGASEQEAIAKTILSYSVAYGLFAGARTHVAPFIQNMLGLNTPPEQSRLLASASEQQNMLAMQPNHVDIRMPHLAQSTVDGAQTVRG